MRRAFVTVIAVCGLYLSAGGQGPGPAAGLPQLHQIKTVTLSPAYSCRPSEEFGKGYGATALFLSDFARQRTGPDLLFNGACGAEDYFQAATAGDDMSLIADLGTGVPLEDISAARAFNLPRTHSFPFYTKFAQAVKVEAGHTYAVLLNARDKRGLFVFSVAEYVPNRKVSLRYAVKSYQVTTGGQAESHGFSWERGNAL